MSKNKEKVLSASRVKTLESCSWTYWSNYHLKIPQTTNSGALRGTICHLVFELLLNKRHKKHFTTLKKKKFIASSPAIERLVRKHLIKDNINDDENYSLCDEMIITGIETDFFGKGGRVGKPEEEFLLKKEDEQGNILYQIMGYIDKNIKYSKDKTIKIVDYKSSKSKFQGEELTSNVQAMTYTLAAQDLWPKFEKVIVEFQFLRFPDEPSQRLEFSNAQLDGFEHYLQHLYNIINNFSESDAKSNFAAHQSMPPKGGGFKGPLNCGFAKQKGQLKKDGTLMWHCPYKFELDYYALVDENGEVKRTAFKKSDLKESEGLSIKAMHYDGCPAHKKPSAKHDDFDF